MGTHSGQTKGIPGPPVCGNSVRRLIFVANQNSEAVGRVAGYAACKGNKGMIVPCLSVRQPWANWLVDGRKPVETRRWMMKHRGLLAIHASKTIDENVPCQPDEKYPVGAIIGFVEVTACRKMTKADEQAAMCHIYPKAHAIVCKHPVKMERPYYCPGSLGIFKRDIPPGFIPDEVKAKLHDKKDNI